MASSDPAPIRKIFVVGCPRSGTTVTQSLLAALPGVMSMGETNFLLTLLGQFDGWIQDDPEAPEAWRRRLGLARVHTRQRLQACLDGAFAGNDRAPRLRGRLTGRGYIDAFCKALDEEAIRRGHACWVEKTPDHLAYASIIPELIPGAHVLHVVRRGQDVVASAIEAQCKYMEHRHFLGGIPYWVQRWNQATRTHMELAGHPSHTVLPYECLLKAPEEVRALLDRLAGAELGTDWPLNDQNIAKLTDEPWKSDAVEGVIQAPKRKFEQVFGPTLQVCVKNALLEYSTVLDACVEKQPHLPWMRNVRDPAYTVIS